MSREWVESPTSSAFFEESMREMYEFSDRIKSRSKGHMLVHSALDIARFGPLVNVMTEAFEVLNKHCRQRFAYSNNRAPGRDTAIDFAKIQTENFVLDGGQWRHSDEGMVPLLL